MKSRLLVPLLLLPSCTFITATTLTTEPAAWVMITTNRAGVENGLYWCSQRAGHATCIQACIQTCGEDSQSAVSDIVQPLPEEAKPAPVAKLSTEDLPWPKTSADTRAPSLTRELIIEIMDKNLDALQFCLADAKRSRRLPRGLIQFTMNWIVRADGSVANVYFAGPDNLRDSVVVRCLQNTLSKFRFPISEGDVRVANYQIISNDGAVTLNWPSESP